MFEVTQKKKIADNTFLIQIRAPEIARKSQPGQFVMVRVDEKGERIPLSLVDWDRSSITLVFSERGYTTRKLARLKKGNALKDVVGPLGNPVRLPQNNVACIAAVGLGIAAVLPVVKRFRKANNRLVVVIGAKSRDYLFFEKELCKLSDQLHICTEDGSRGEKARITEPFFRVMRKRIDIVVAAGPVEMLRELCRLSRHRARTYTLVNSIMLDGMGMCGCCRLTVDGKTKFSCIDGPVFDGHLVDWDELAARAMIYEKEERHLCRLK
jgi:ferredoxin--NADP+ reductase